MTFATNGEGYRCHDEPDFTFFHVKTKENSDMLTLCTYSEKEEGGVITLKWHTVCQSGAWRVTA